MQRDWELSHSFVSDGRSIRCCCVLPGNTSGAVAYRLVAGTQGGSLWEFAIPTGEMHAIEYQHDHDVTAIISNDKIYVTGCRDGAIRIFSHSHEFQAALNGHEKAVTSLSWVGDKYLVSGSWDGTAKVWSMETRVLLTTLDNHENSVSVVGIAMDESVLSIATGSAGIAQNKTISDHTTRIWNVNTKTSDKWVVHKVANDHDGPIRSLCIASNGLLASCSNDGTVKLRSIDTAECLATLTFPVKDVPMLLSVTKVGQMLAASAEDGHVVVWLESGDFQIIRHASTVWNVVELPENDFATCGHDGILRVFTQSSDRVAPQDIRDEFNSTLAAALQTRSQGPSQDDIAKLPKWELNALHRGKSDGQVQLFQKQNKAIAAQWSMASQTWIEVGEVMGTNENAGNIDGVKYDHVFPVEIDQPGGRTASLQIGYNTGENPFVAAQRFIDAHVLPQHHLSDIANYIQQRVGQPAPTIGMDTPSTVVAPPSYEHLPIQSYKFFELTKATSFDKMAIKLKENGKLSEQDFAFLQSLMSTLLATNRYHSSKILSDELQVIRAILTNWPPSEAFGALDLARIIVLHPDATKDSSYWDSIIKLALQQCTKEVEGMAAVAVPMLALRLFANCYKGGGGALEAVVANMSPILNCTQSYLQSTNKNIRLSVATVWVNMSSYLNTAENKESDNGQGLVTQISCAMDTTLYDGEAMIRMLVALGTILLADPKAKAAALTVGMVGKVEMVASPHGAKAKAIAREIYTVLNR